VSLLESSQGNYELPPELRLVRLPVDDEQAPAEAHLPLLVRVCELIHRFRLQPGERNGVAVHCLFGRGRTGMLLAAYRAYVAGRYPDDGDGRSAAEARAEIDRHLYVIAGGPVTALTDAQVQWLDRFAQHCRKLSTTPPDSAVAADLGWSRRQTQSLPASDRCVWRCPDCEGVAEGEPGLTLGPLWCPTCGWPTEASVHPAT
jgi:hypothetical protein